MARVKSCSRNHIQRRSYVRKDGIKVRSSCIKKHSYNKVIKSLKKGGLMGYKLSETAKERRAHLKRVIKNDGWTTTFRRLNALRVLMKNSQYAKKINADIEWLRKE